MFPIMSFFIPSCHYVYKNIHICAMTSQGEDLDFAYDSISAFSMRRENQEAVFGSEEGLKDIR